MKVVLAGSTGFIGRALVCRLLRDGHRVVAWVRDPHRARGQVGAEVELVDARGGPAALRDAVEGAGAVVNLAGESVAGARWTARRKKALVQSRVETTRALVDAIQAADHKPDVLVSASAIGLFGDRGDEVLDEDSPPGQGFLADLCVAWEAEGMRAQASGVRVVTPRLGVVLGAEGGALATMLPPFRLGLGGRLGSGKQWVSWVHLHDAVEALVTCITDQTLRGPVNVTAPLPVTNRELTETMGATLSKRASLVVPGFALRATMGQSADIVLQSQRVLPRRLEAAGFRFRFTGLPAALRDILVPAAQPEIRVATPADAARVPGSRFVLNARLVVDAPLERVFPFFSRAANLGLLTPAWTDFRFKQDPGAESWAGQTFDYTLRIAGAPVGWRTLIKEWEQGHRFVDVQERGPYALWHHEHRFTADGQHTVVEDEVHYALPLGPLGSVAHHVAVAGMLRRIFSFRARAIALRFGLTASLEATTPGGNHEGDSADGLAAGLRHVPAG
jgi:hypothetical protein